MCLGRLVALVARLSSGSLRIWHCLAKLVCLLGICVFGHVPLHRHGKDPVDTRSHLCSTSEMPDARSRWRLDPTAPVGGLAPRGSVGGLTPRGSVGGMSPKLQLPMRAQERPHPMAGSRWEASGSTSAASGSTSTPASGSTSTPTPTPTSTASEKRRRTVDSVWILPRADPVKAGIIAWMLTWED